jgi:hypothetical protein
MKWVPGVVPALPVIFQVLLKELAGTAPVSCAASRLVKPAPLPAKVFEVLFKVTEFVYAPERPAPANTFPAVMA